MKSLTWIYLIALALMLFHGQTSFKRSSVIPPTLPSKFTNQKAYALANGYVLGNKTLIKKEDKIPYKRLNLQHLFTPSGIHLTSLYVLIIPLLGLIKKSFPKIGKILHFTFLLFPYLLSGFYSLKRISLLRIFSLFIKKQTSFPNFVNLFFMTFFLDYLFGTFSSSPLSFTFSFLFIGVIFCMGHLPKAWLFFPLFGGQILIAFVQQSPLSIIGSFEGFLLTGLFSFLFPFIFGFSIIPLPVTHHLSTQIIMGFDLLVVKAFDFSNNFPLFTPSLIMAFGVLFLSLKTDSNTKFVVIVIAGIFHFNDLANLPRNVLGKNPPQTKIKLTYPLKKIVLLERGYSFKDADNTTCRATLFNTFYLVRCHKLKSAAL